MEKIVDRIRKLLALAGNNTSGAEREAALSKAHAMLLAHNLQMSDVAGNDRIDVDVTSTNEFFNHAKPWSRYICAAIAKLYFCKFVWDKTHDNKLKIIFIGTRVDATIAHDVCQMILKSVWAEGLRFARSHKSSGHTQSRMMTDFVNNAGVAIWFRCDEMMKAAQAGESDGRALVVVDMYKKKAEAADAWADANLKLANPKKTSLMMNASGAAAAGAQHGRTVPITMTVAGHG